MDEAKKRRYLWLAVISILFGLYCIYAALYSAWQAAADISHQQIHAISLYAFLALVILSFSFAGIVIYIFKYRKHRSSDSSKSE